MRRRKAINRKLTSVIASATLATMVCACNRAPTGSPGSAVDNRPKISVGEQEYLWVAATVTSPFYTEGKAGWDAAAKSLGVRAQLVGPVDTDVSQQVTMIEQAIAKPTTAGILVYAMDYNALDPVLLRARAAGIPVITGYGDSKNRAVRNSFVGVAQETIGRVAADLVVKLLNGKGKVGIVSFVTTQAQKDRVKGFEDRVKEAYPGIEILGIAPEDGTYEGETKAAAAFLQAHPDVNLLWITDSGGGYIARVIMEAGLAGKVLVVASDRTPELLDAIRKGTVSATIAQDTYAEEWASLHFLYWLYNKATTVPETCFTAVKVITKENVDE